MTFNVQNYVHRLNNVYIECTLFLTKCLASLKVHLGFDENKAYLEFLTYFFLLFMDFIVFFYTIYESYCTIQLVFNLFSIVFSKKFSILVK